MPHSHEPCKSTHFLLSYTNIACYQRPISLTGTLLDRNTTLPHPDADTGPNPVIESAELVHARSHSIRNSISHKRFHHSRKGSGAAKDPMEELDGDIQYEDGGSVVLGASNFEAARGTPTEESEDEKQEPQVETRTVSVMGGEDAGAHEKEDGELTIEELRDEQGYREGERKKGVLRKIGLHKV